MRDTVDDAPNVRSSFTISQIRARLLRLMLLRSGRSRLEVPILMTCNPKRAQCRHGQHMLSHRFSTQADHNSTSGVHGLIRSGVTLAERSGGSTAMMPCGVLHYIVYWFHGLTSILDALSLLELQAGVSAPLGCERFFLDLWLLYYIQCNLHFFKSQRHLSLLLVRRSWQGCSS